MSDPTVRHYGIDSARVIQVIETIATRGEGVVGDPVRKVKQYWTLDGALLAERDWHGVKTMEQTT